MKKFLSILLSVAMLMTILPATLGFAADETAKYTLTFRDGDRDGVVELGEELTYTWKFDSGYEYVNNLDFNIEYNADYLTPKSLTGKIISVTDDNWEVKPEENKITGYLMATGNVWTKEEEEDEDTGDISVNKLNLLVAKFTVKDDVPANTKANIVLNITNYQKYDNGGVDVPVEVAQYGEFTINPQEVVEQSSDATLKSLAYGDTAIELVADKYTYDVELPYGVAAPAITYEVNDAKASAVLDGNKVVVTAEDGTELTYTINFTNAAPAVTGIKVNKESVEVPYANKDAVADYVKANIEVNYVTEAGDGEAVEVFEVEAAEGVATVTVGEYKAEVAYEIADPLALDITVDKESIEVPYANKDAVAEYVKANIEVKFVMEDGNFKAVEAFEVEAEDGVATVIVGEFTKTVEYTIAAKLYKLNVSAVNGTILATYEDKVDEDWDTSAVKEFATGTNVTLKAVAEEDAEFVYWMDATTKNVVYYGEEYAVVMGTDKNLLAVSAPVAEDVFTVEFTDFNNKVYVHTTSDVEITVPADPYVLGYTFEGWAIAGVKTDYVAGDVIDANTFTADTKLKAIQTVDETKYAITLIGANEAGGEYEYNKTVTVTPAVPEGKVFAYWMRDDEIVSYNETYKFFVANYPSTVEAVFFEDEAPDAQPTITMAQPVLVGGNKISFMMERNVPEGYSVVEAGIIAKSGIVTTEITLDNKDLIATSANTGAYGAFTVRKANVAEGESWSAAGYLIYTDGAEVYTIYTAPVSYTR